MPLKKIEYYNIEISNSLNNYISFILKKELIRLVFSEHYLINLIVIGALLYPS